MRSGGREPSSQGGPTCSSSQDPQGQSSAQVRVNELYVPMSFMKENFSDVSFPIHVKLQVHVKAPPSAGASRESPHTGIIRKYEHYGNRTFHYLLTSIQPTLRIDGSCKPKPLEWSKLDDGTVRVWLEVPPDPSATGATSTATSDISLGTATAAASLVAGTASSMGAGTAMSSGGPVSFLGSSSGGHLLTGLAGGPGGPGASGEALGVMGSGHDLATTLGMPGMLTSSVFGLPTTIGRNALDPVEMEDSTQPMRQQAATSMDHLLEMIHPIGASGASAFTGTPSLHTVHSGGSSGHHLARMSHHDDDAHQLPSATMAEHGMVQMPGTSLPLIPLLGDMLGLGGGGMAAVMSAEQLQQQMVELVKKYRALQAELASTRNNLLTAESNLSHVQQELQKCRQELEATRTQHAQQQTLRRQLASTTASSAHNFMNTLTQLLALQ